MACTFACCGCLWFAGLYLVCLVGGFDFGDFISALSVVFGGCLCLWVCCAGMGFSSYFVCLRFVVLLFDFVLLVWVLVMMLLVGCV